MKRTFFFIISLLIVFCISSELQADEDDSYFDDQIKRINEKTDEAALQSIIDQEYYRGPGKYKPYHQHIKNAAKIKLILLDPTILNHYGELQIDYNLRRDKKEYGVGIKCTLYVEHVTILITGSSGNTVSSSRFDGRPGGTQESFPTTFGVCSSKTNEAPVEISRIRADLFKNIPEELLPTPTPIPPTPTPIQPPTSKYEVQILNGHNVVLDSVHNLMWQQSGSKKKTTWDNANGYIEYLNKNQFAGFSDWRLPTLEELKLLVEPTKKRAGLFIDPAFDSEYVWCWSADKDSTGKVWTVNFISEGKHEILLLKNAHHFVRAVRHIGEDVPTQTEKEGVSAVNNSN